jgi:hypothetical protein
MSHVVIVCIKTDHDSYAEGIIFSNHMELMSLGRIKRILLELPIVVWYTT